MSGSLEDQRILELEKEVITLRIKEAQLIASVEHLAQSQDKLTKSVEDLAVCVSDLRDVMNRGRGALWGIGLGAATLGSIGSYAASKLFGL